MQKICEGHACEGSWGETRRKLKAVTLHNKSEAGRREEGRKEEDNALDGVQLSESLVRSCLRVVPHPSFSVPGPLSCVRRQSGQGGGGRTLTGRDLRDTHSWLGIPDDPVKDT